ncbi:MAG: hypothetical protein ACJ8FY_27230 [Gemmataceae bacterium]
MLIALRWLKVLGALALVFGILAFLESSPASAQRSPTVLLLRPVPVDKVVTNVPLPLDPLSGALRPYMPPRPIISNLQNNGQQFGFNGITGSTNTGTGFAGGVAGLGGGGAAGLAGGQFGIGGSLGGGLGGGLAGLGGGLGGGLAGLGGGGLGGGGLGGLGGGLAGLGGGLGGLGGGLGGGQLGVGGLGGLGGGKLGLVGNGLYGQ